MKPYPLDPELYEEVKEEAKSIFDVYPSIVANSWIVQQYKALGGRYGGDRSKGGLVKWFEERWVDISRPRKDGSYPFCARSSQDEPGYPKCVPLAVALSMTEEQRRSAVVRKRAAERGSKKKKRGRRPINVPTF
jgi:hypothetical protein